ncbi:unnamed protein product [Musa banksii]
MQSSSTSPFIKIIRVWYLSFLHAVLEVEAAIYEKHKICEPLYS